MTVCARCGNVYHDMFTVTWGGQTASFDSIECAVTELAPVCDRARQAGFAKMPEQSGT